MIRCLTGALLALLFLSGCGAGRGSIVVGKNVLVSASRPNVRHEEVMIAADPTNSRRLIACGTIFPRATNGDGGVSNYALGERTVAYVSTDGGQAWAPAAAQNIGSWDSDCTYDGSGRAFFVSGSDILGNKATLVMADNTGRWNRAFQFPFHDRAWVAAFGRNDVYLSYSGGRAGFLRTSHDGGKSFGPALPAYYQGKRFFLAGNLNHPAFLEDGTWLSALTDSRCAGLAKQPDLTELEGAQYLEVRQKESRVNPGLHMCLDILRLTPGAPLVQVLGKIPQYAVFTAYGETTLPTIASDPGSRCFKDRVYIAWADNRTGRYRIYVIHSADRGATWSSAQAIDDASWGNPLDRGPDNVSPAVAVNEAGAVLVVWEDRRDNPDDRGYYMRASASLDGGDSWLPSVRISEAPNTFLQDNAVPFPTVEKGLRGEPTTVALAHRPWTTGGDTLGLVAASDGIFHALWVDDRTGLPQIWTSPIVLNGTVTKYGDPSLDALTDETDRVQIWVHDARFDRNAGTAWVELQLGNVSKQALRDIKLRVLSASSAFASVSSPYSIVSFPGALQPGQTSGVQRFTVILRNMQPEDGRDLVTDALLNLKIRVFAR